MRSMKKILAVSSAFSSAFSYLLAQEQPQDSLKNKLNIGFQATIISQYHPKFSADYTGDNSLQPNSESATSLTSTLYINYHFNKNTQIIFTPEVAGGKGLSGATGVAGFPNGEIFRVGEPTPKVYIARLALEKSFDLKNDNKLRFVVGKYSLADYFDNNPIAHDPRAQFMNWSLMSSGAWDYPANVRGYTMGLLAEYIFRNNWSLRANYALEPTMANGTDLSYKMGKDFGLTFEIQKDFYKEGDLFTRVMVLGYRNQAPMVPYRLAIQENVNLTEISGVRNTKYGLSLNLYQKLSEHLSGFVRTSWNDGKNETWAFTEIDNSLSGGVNVNGKLWHRPDDNFGIALVTNGISKDHQNYLKDGHYGFIIGDGNLNYGRETALEAYYNLCFMKYYNLSADYQFVNHPAYNQSRGPVSFFSLRFHFQI